jgi:hypothetical protein
MDQPTPLTLACLLQPASGEFVIVFPLKPINVQSGDEDVPLKPISVGDGEGGE